jgi:molecular chaperone HscB
MKLDSDDFELFGVPRRFAQQRSELDARWRALQAEVHPDRFVAEGAAAQRIAMQWAVRVNEAHQRLRDPLKRAAYLCELQGAPIEAENNTAMPAAFLMQQMAWREALDEAGDLSAVEQLAGEVEGFRDAALAELARTLDERADPTAAAQQVRALMFVERFAADIDHRLEALGR